MCSALGRDLLPGELIHHIHEDKEDNRLEMLELSTNAKHNVIHNKDKQRDTKGRFTKCNVNRQKTDDDFLCPLDV
jgi:hypothetical protein